MTYNGGSGGSGSIFSISTNGTNFEILHSFTGGSNNGYTPYGSLTLIDGKLFGMTQGGGSSNEGTIFNMNTDGTGFGVDYSFAGGTADGELPYGDLVASSDGSTVYGMTARGGPGGVIGGVVFAEPLTVPEPTSSGMLAAAAASAALLVRPRRARRPSRPRDRFLIADGSGKF